MNPATGEFHEVVEKGVVKNAGQVVLDRHRKMRRDEKAILHSSHIDLVIKATRKPVPEHWPIFKIGGTYLFNEVELTLEKIVGKDMHFVGEGAQALVHQTAKIKGHRFRARKFDGRCLWLRPVKGLPRAYLNQ